MNFEIKKSNIKGKDEISLTVWASDSLENDFFKALFEDENNMEIIKPPNSKEQIIIRKKEIE